MSFNGDVIVIIESIIIGTIVFSHGVTSYLFKILISVSFTIKSPKRMPTKMHNNITYMLTKN